jgi:hypothetical protein
VAVTAAAIALILYYLYKNPSRSPLLTLALAFILSGALGNLIDRVRYGEVIDFLDFYLGRVHWPAFNVADTAICIGAALLFLDLVGAGGGKTHLMPDQRHEELFPGLFHQGHRRRRYRRGGDGDESASRRTYSHRFFGEDSCGSTLIPSPLADADPQIIVSPNEEHKLILEKVGATEVIIPEREMAAKVARGLAFPNVLDYLPLSDDYMIFELAAPNSLLGKTLAELQLRRRYTIDVIAVRDVLTDRLSMIPSADFVVKDGEVLVVVGQAKDIEKIR